MVRQRGEPTPPLEHFGERLRPSKFGIKMTREMFAYPNRSPHQRVRRDQVEEQTWELMAWAYRDGEQTQHSDAYLLVQRDDAMVNFDLSMRYFASLDVGEFETALNNVLVAGRTFEEVRSLKQFDGVTGAYVMVFDEYRQFYIGESTDIRRRIKDHWSKRKGFDRLIFGSKYDSIFPVDELRALDTTRIYAAKSRSPHALEQRAEKAADGRFCLNRVVGGSRDFMMLPLPILGARSRTLVSAAGVLTIDEYQKADDEASAVVADLSVGGTNAMANLISLDTSIFSVSRGDGSQFMWSRRDTVIRAAKRGDMTTDQFAEYIDGIGGHVIWLED